MLTMTQGFEWYQFGVSNDHNDGVQKWRTDDGNQILAVFPELRMVVAFAAGNYGRDPRSAYYSFFEEFILPVVRRGGKWKVQISFLIHSPYNN